MKILKYGLVLLFSVTLWGCGKGNSNSPAAIDPATGKHVIANWKVPTIHGGIDYGASKDMAACQECHGKDFAGGISKRSCINTAGCHGVGVNSPHPAAPWRGGLVTHTLVKETNAVVCATCHAKGNNYAGPPLVPVYSSAAPGCFNSTLCHDVVGHKNDPVPWAAPANHGANPGVTGRLGAKFSIQACQTCHATMSTTPNPYPLFTNPKTGMPGGCSSAGCHDQNVNLAHPYVWLPNRVPGITTSHASAGDLGNSCVLCHGATLAGGDAAPSCMSAGISGIKCHSTRPDAAPTGCTSCHGAPPNGISPPSVLPNREFVHKTHWVSGLAAVANKGGCAVCHFGKGPGTATHAMGGAAEVVFLASPTVNFNEFGTATYTPATGICSNISCHGRNDQFIALWTDTTFAALDPLDPISCYNCHQVSTLVQPSSAGLPAPVPYIGPFSGQVSVVIPTRGNNMHQAHTVAIGAFCTDCHNLSVHYNNIMQGRRFLAPGTANTLSSLGGAGTSIVSYSFNAATGTSSCTSSCHGATIKSWY